VSEQVQRRAQDMTTRELTAQLGDQFSQLAKEEIALARAELFASARQSMLGGGMLGAAAVVGLTCWLAMVAAAIAGIAAGLPVWAAALIVGGALGVAAAVLGLLGTRRLARGTPPLEMTIGSIKDGLNDLAARVRARP
jgi:Putative Actinobacterial Holin-X, holin superfamily III